MSDLKLTTTDDPYGSSIVMYLSKILGGTNLNNFKQLLQELTEALYANKDVRFGPMPDPEAVVTVRSITKHYIDASLPIPVLIPWGSIKAKFGETIDIAEISAINQLAALIERVRRIYAPGLDIVIRVEDTSGYHLYMIDLPKDLLLSGTRTYIEGLRKLVSIVDKTNSIQVVYESEMPGAKLFNSTVARNEPVFLKYIKTTDGMLVEAPSDVQDLIPYHELEEMGWKGVISTQQREHYYRTYSKIYGLDPAKNQLRLASYMAEALTRKQLNMSGKKAEWDGGYIQVTFVPPVVGLPHGYDANYIYYRTIPENCGRTHMSPWRSKGYLKVQDTIGGAVVTPKLANFNEPKNYIPLVSTLTNTEGAEVTFRSDYILE